MKFGGHATGTERLAEVIIRNQAIDPSPSRRTIAGSDEKVLNLRPEIQDKFLGSPGHFRIKAQTSA